MAVRTNPYNNPEIGQGFSNLAGLFAPPSGAEASGWAVANAKNAEAKRLADLFSYAQAPGYNQGQADRMGVAAGLYAPSSSFYAVDATNSTSRANNAADNTRALGVAQLQDRGETQRTLLAPVQAGATRFVGPGLADQFGIPETQVGTVALAPGERAFTADGGSFAGVPKPLTESEAKGAAFSGLTVDEQRALALSDAPVEQVAGPNGEPQFARRSDAVGQQAYVNKGAQARPSNGIAVLPGGGGRVPAIQDPSTGRWKNSQTGADLPEGIQIFDIPKPQGTASDVGLPQPTVANTTDANRQRAEVTRSLATLDLYEGIIDNNPGVIGLAGVIRGTAQNAGATIADLTKSFGDKAPRIAEAANEVRAGLQQVAPALFDPAIPEAEFLQGTLAYSLARSENPSGEVSARAYNSALERIRGGGLLANSQSAKAAINTHRKVLQGQLTGIGALQNPSTARTDTGLQSAGDAGAPPTATPAPVRVSTPDEARRLPSGTPIMLPDGSTGVVP